LQLGRAFVLLGDKTKAKAAYHDFLTLWKAADPDIPILRQAKAESTAKAIEMEDIEARLTALEEAAENTKHSR
jgi:hypothetical protein